ncbi:MAG: DsbA family oxidoreductase [Alphaproteobacteria bacterium]|nr:DsbA family oxidoreductase [Alphaproteobacteria bacterium SS10]
MLIEIFADVVCPWCYIGKRRLDRALDARGNSAADLRWLPFQLNPDMPAEGMDRFAYLSLKFGSRERALQVLTMLEQTAERDGIGLNLDLIRRTPNTVDAHRLVRFADRNGKASAMVDKLFDGYFVEGLDTGDLGVLAGLAEELGMDRPEVEAFLDSDDERAAVRSSDINARRLGVHAVPCFIVDQQYAIAGAHDPETFAPLFDLSSLDQMASLETVGASIGTGHSSA